MRPQGLESSWLAQGALSWRCHNCPRILGYILGNRFISYHAHRLFDIRVDGEARQICDRCGAENVWIVDQGPLGVQAHDATPAR